MAGGDKLNPCNTGYEFSRVYIRQLDKNEVIEFDNYMGIECEKCGATESDNWYIEKLINNYLPDNRIVCEKCK